MKSPKPKNEEEKTNSVLTISDIEDYKYKNITKEIAENYIQEYWINGIIILIISTLFYFFQGQLTDFFIYDAIFIALLIFGIYKKIRLVGVIFFIYFLIGKIIIFATYPGYINIITILISLSFLKSFYLGILGLFKWHEINKKN